MRITLLRSTLLAALLASGALPSLAISFTESDFTTWTSVPISGLFPELNVTTSATGGNPGSYLRVQAPTDDFAASFSYDTAGGFTWDPATGNPGITTISLDILETSAPASGIFIGFGAKQNGYVFVVPGEFDVALGNANTWRTSSDGGAPILAEDIFVNIDAAFGGPGPLFLDVSKTGSPITFGLFTASDFGGLDSDVGIDNLRLDVVAVPDNGASLSLLAMGLFGLGTVRTRRAKA
jgi:hypothetical protein